MRSFLLNPSAPEHFGLTKLKYDDDEMTGMPPQDELDKAELDGLVEYMCSLSAEPYDPPIDEALAAKGKVAFDDGECSGCHTMDGEEGDAPMLLGYGSRAWLKGLLRKPTHPLYYGELGDEMPAFDHLDERDEHYLITWLLELKTSNDKTSSDSR